MPPTIENEAEKKRSTFLPYIQAKARKKNKANKTCSMDKGQCSVKKDEFVPLEYSGCSVILPSPRTTLSMPKKLKESTYTIGASARTMESSMTKESVDIREVILSHLGIDSIRIIHKKKM
jgi:hypothetical protein